ncbi:MAG TPA: L,D-transpeptidase [Terriglobales bacterium]|nr:L,D-transpeptidase [Terriglobales bacterium]
MRLSNNKAPQVLGALLLLALPVMGQRCSKSVRERRTIVVSIPDRKLAVIEEGKTIRTFPVAVGARVSPSPAGGFQVINRVTRPTYYHPGVVIPAGKDNPLGPRWIGLNKKGYGIHGTNEPRSIGKAASHGCIRLRNRDIKELFEMVSVGDVVEIRTEMDQETAEIFAENPRTPAPAIAAADLSVVAGGQ